MAGAHRLTASAPAEPAPTSDKKLWLPTKHGFAASARQLDTSAAAGGPRWNTGGARQQTIEEAEAWGAYEKLPEVNNLVMGTANLMSQVRLYAGMRTRVGNDVVETALRDDTGAPLYGFTDQEVADAEDIHLRYTDPAGSQAGLLHPMSQCWSVVGGVRIVGWELNPDGQPRKPDDPRVPPEELDNNMGERWVAVAPSSVWRTGRGSAAGVPWAVQTRRKGTTTVYDPIIHELWWAHPQYPDDAMGWVMAALEVCRDLRAFTLAQRSAARSGIPADLFLVPTEASPKKAQQVGWGPGVEGGFQEAESAAESWAGEVEELLGEFILGVLEDADSGNSAVPGVLAVEGQFIEKFNKVSFARSVDRGLNELVKGARDRLAESADCPPEMLRGLGSTNRWNGAQIADDEYRRYFRPKTNAIADGWTTTIFWPEMAKRGHRPERYRLMRTLPDASEVVAGPDFSKIAPVALDRKAIGPSGFRRMLSIPEWAAPTPDEHAAWEAEKAAAAAAKLPKPPGDSGAPEAPEPVNESKGSVLDTTGHEVRSTAAAVPADDLAAALLRIEHQARARLEEACEAALDRSIDRAGSMLRNWARREGGDLRALVTAAGVTTGQVPGLLGPQRAERLFLAEAGDNQGQLTEDMLATALVALLLAFRRISLAAYASAIALLDNGAPAQADIDAAVTRGEDVLRASMMALAYQQLFNPPGEPTIGELNDLRVPLPVLRRALAVAGGALGVGAGLEPDREASIGLVFGPILDRVAPPSNGWRWAYGTEARQQTFEPHRELDGQVYSGPNDQRLAGSVFAAAGGLWHPGDHNGCRCDFVRAYTITES